jgi:tRNA(Ile)-lysidine synthase
MELLGEVAKTIEKYALLSPGERVLVGVSGGPDSICLMHALDKLGYEVIVAHLDHQLRAESSQDAAHVQEIAAQHRLQMVTERAQFSIRSRSIEEAGRNHRYAYFLRIAIEMGLKSIAVGHTADDQSETILMHFLRGTGPEGLRGMLPKRSMAQWGHESHSRAIMLIRPLLKLPRSMIEDYVENAGLDALHDPSNRDVSFTRNRIRHEILPLLKEFNPGMDKTLQRMADIMQAEVELLDEILDDSISKLSIQEEDNRIIVKRGPFLQFHPALQRVFLRRIFGFSDLKNGAIGFEAIENALRFLRNSAAWGAIDIGNDLELQRFSEKALIQKASARPLLSEYPQLAAALNLEPNSAVTELEEGWAIKASEDKLTAELQQIITGNQDHSRAFLDAAVMRKSPFLRAPKVGERFQPLGMTGSTKLSDFFINQKIPRPARKNWPLFASDEEIYWVVGLQIAESFRIRTNTERLLRLELISK